MNYVAHDCRNSRLSEQIRVGEGKSKKDYIPNPDFCNNRWIDKDLTGATTQIPTWKYCRECCEKLGIDFEKQKPSDYRTEEQNEKIKNTMEKLKQKRQSEIRNTELN